MHAKTGYSVLTKLLLQYLIISATSCSKQASLLLQYKRDDCLLTWTENSGPWRDGNARFQKRFLSALIVFAGIDTRTPAFPAVALINFSAAQICSAFHCCNKLSLCRILQGCVERLRNKLFIAAAQETRLAVCRKINYYIHKNKNPGVAAGLQTIICGAKGLAAGPA